MSSSDIELPGYATNGAGRVCPLKAAFFWVAPINSWKQNQQSGADTRLLQLKSNRLPKKLSLTLTACLNFSLFRDIQNITNLAAKIDTPCNPYHPLANRIGLKTGDMTYNNCAIPHGFYLKDVSRSIKVLNINSLLNWYGNCFFNADFCAGLACTVIII